jgi:predicted Zn-dependent protease
LPPGRAEPWAGCRSSRLGTRAARSSPSTWVSPFTGRATTPRRRRPGAHRVEPARELDALARAARTDGARAKILYGVALQRLNRPRSAERQFAAAAREAPNDPEARVAAAVGRFDKANPSAAFSRLGPLVRVFPHAQTVRFHLGLLLLWIGQVKQARNELQLARSEDPKSTLGEQASAYLSVLAKAGTE